MRKGPAYVARISQSLTGEDAFDTQHRGSGTGHHAYPDPERLSHRHRPDRIIAGLSEGTANILNSVVFISMNDFARLRGNMQISTSPSGVAPMQAVSFVLVKVAQGASPDAVAARKEQEIPGMMAQSREAFAGQERKLVKDMGLPLLISPRRARSVRS